MKISVFMAVALGALSVAYGEVSVTSRLERDCVRAMDAAKSNAMWRWEWRGPIDSGDDVFQQELREALQASHAEAYREALASSGAADEPRMAGLRKALTSAVTATRTMRQISEAAARHGFLDEVQFDVGQPTLAPCADNSRVIVATVRACGRSANVTDVLRASLKQVRCLGHNAVITPENLPVSWHEWRNGKPVFKSRCQNVGGYFKYSCSYRTMPESECPWQTKARMLAKPRTFASIDRETVWSLLAKAPTDYTFADVLKALGRPRQSMSLRCSNCKATDMRWAYDIRDTDIFGDSLMHLLVFSFAPDGRCTGWYWEAA